MKNWLKYLILGSIGGLIYNLIEILWRGYTDVSMFFVAFIIFIIIGGINNWFDWNLPLFYQMIISSVIITGIEFVSGCILNLWLHLNIWDYSNVPGNLLGQICIPYYLLWFMLSFIAILFDDTLRYVLFKEEFPHYYIAGKCIVCKFK